MGFDFSSKPSFCEPLFHSKPKSWKGSQNVFFVHRISLPNFEEKKAKKDFFLTLLFCISFFKQKLYIRLLLFSFEKSIHFLPVHIFFEEKVEKRRIVAKNLVWKDLLTCLFFFSFFFSFCTFKRFTNFFFKKIKTKKRKSYVSNSKVATWYLVFGKSTKNESIVIFFFSKAFLF